MPIKNIPIIKTLVATLAVLIGNLTKIIEIIILPIILSTPLILEFIEILPQIREALKANSPEMLTNLNFGFEMILYTIMFVYGILSLHINLYRMAASGVGSVFAYGIVPIGLVLKLLPFYFFIEFLVVVVGFLQIQFLEPIVFMLVAHILLKFVAIATNSQTTSTLIFIDRLNIAIIQFIIPILFLTIFLLLGVGFLIIIAKIFTIIFSALSLGLIFNSINK